jgi:branched-chain amino acid transport system substrate-binding protein
MFASRALRLLLAFVSTAGLLLAVGGCASAPALPKGNTQSLAIGAILPLSGPNALVGKSMKQGLELAVADVNASGGINGKPISLGIIDSQGDLAEGAKAIQLWRERNVPVLLIGDTSLAIHEAEDLADYPVLVGFLTDYVAVPSLAPKNGVRIFLNGDQESRTIEAYLTAAGVNKVAILCAGTDIGASNGKYAEFLIHGDYISTYRDSYTPTDRNYLPLVKAMSAMKADALVLAGYGPEYSSIAAAFELEHWQGLVLGYMGQFTLDGLGNSTGLAASILYPVPAYIVNPSGTDNGKNFVKEYHDIWGRDPDLPTAYAYDNIRALAASAAQAHSLDPQKIRAGFLSLKSYAGVAGNYSIMPDGDTEMPLHLVTGNGQPAPPPPKPTQAPAISNVARPVGGMGSNLTELYYESTRTDLRDVPAGPLTTAPANARPAPAGQSYTTPANTTPSGNTTAPPADNSPPPSISVPPLTTTPIRE